MVLILKNVDITSTVYFVRTFDSLFVKGFHYSSNGVKYIVYPSQIKLYILTEHEIEPEYKRFFCNTISDISIAGYKFTDTSNDHFYIKKKVQEKITVYNTDLNDTCGQATAFNVKVYFISADSCNYNIITNGYMPLFRQKTPNAATVLIDNLNMFSLCHEKILLRMPNYNDITSIIIGIEYRNAQHYLGGDIHGGRIMDLTNTILNFIQNKRLMPAITNHISYMPYESNRDLILTVYRPQSNGITTSTSVKLEQFNFNLPCPITGLPFVDKVYLFKIETRTHTVCYVPSATDKIDLIRKINVPAKYSLVEIKFVHIPFNKEVLKLLSNKHRNYIEGYLEHGLVNGKNSTIVMNLRSNQLFYEPKNYWKLHINRPGIILCLNCT